LAYLTGFSHEFVEQFIKLLKSFPFFWRVESRNDFNKEVKIMSYHPGKNGKMLIQVLEENALIKILTLWTFVRTK